MHLTLIINIFYNLPCKMYFHLSNRILVLLSDIFIVRQLTEKIYLKCLRVQEWVGEVGNKEFQQSNVQSSSEDRQIITEGKK